MDPENGMVNHLEEHVEPLVTRRRSRNAVVLPLQDVGINLEFVSNPALDYHSTLPQQFSPHQSSVPPYGGDDSGINITIDPIDQIQPEADSSRGKAKLSLKEIVEEDETAVEYEPENKPKAGPSKSQFDRSEDIQSSKESQFDRSEDIQSSPYTSPMGEGAKQRYRDIYRPLYQAALEGNWPVARGVIEEYPEAVHSRITEGQETPLHLAAAMKHESFLKELLQRMKPEHLEIKDNGGNTAFCFAAASGNVKMARLMVDRNTNLPNIRGAKGVTPLFIAALLGHRDMAWYLVDVTDLESLEDDDFNKLFFASIDGKLFDVALLIVERHEWRAGNAKGERHESVARARNEEGETALHVLVREGSQQVCWWQRWISLFLDRLTGDEPTDCRAKLTPRKARKLLLNLLWAKVQKYYDPIFPELKSLLFLATEFGNVEFVTVLIESYPDLVYAVDYKGQTMFHVAVACRQKKVFNLIYRIGAIKDRIAIYKDIYQNNLLHLAGMLAPESHLSKISGAALQMQEELIWFKEVERIVIPIYREMKNCDQKSPRVLFTKAHKLLKRRGEEWMKATANSCILAGTLIATVMFAAAFTVPGGNKDVDGTPHFLKTKAFMVFAISDAVSLFSSVTSILTFLSILTSRYAETDFLILLPMRLIIGLLTLFISIVTMIVAFSATFFIVLGHDLFAQVEKLVIALACVPITFFAALQFPLFADVIYSTYKASFLLGLNQRRVKKHKWTRTSMPLKAM